MRLVIAVVIASVVSLCALPSAQAQSLGGFALQLRAPLGVGAAGPQRGAQIRQHLPPLDAVLSTAYTDGANRADGLLGLRLVLDPIFGYAVGVGLAIVGVVVGALAAGNACTDNGSGQPMDRDSCGTAVLIGGNVGFFLGVPLGVTAMGAILQGVGNLWMATLGAFIGTLVAIPTSIGIYYATNGNQWIGSLVSGILVTVGATVFYEIANADGVAWLRTHFPGVSMEPSVAPVFALDGSVTGATVGVRGTNF